MFYKVLGDKKNSTVLLLWVLSTYLLLGPIAQSVTHPTAEPGVASLISAQSHTFVEIGHDIISTVILLPSADSKRVVVSYKRKYMHKLLVNRLFKFAQEKFG